jgi:hypothetical protein
LKAVQSLGTITGMSERQNDREREFRGFGRFAGGVRNRELFERATFRVKKEIVD